MNVGAGVVLIAVGALLGCSVVFGLWHRLRVPIAFGLKALSGAAIGAGALLVQDDADAASWTVTIVALVVLTPLHARLVFGPPGPSTVPVVVADGSAT